MSISQQRRDLFRGSNALDKLALIQALLDSKDLNPDAAFALLNTVHLELRQRGRHNSRVYIRYGEVLGSLHRQMPHIYNEVIARWEASRLGLLKKDSEESTQELQEEELTDTRTEDEVSQRTPTFRSIDKVPTPKMTINEQTVEIGDGTEEELEVPEAEEEREAEEKEASEEKEVEGDKAELEEETEESESKENEEEEREGTEEAEEKDEAAEESESEENEEEEKEEPEEESEEKEKDEPEETETENVEEKEEPQEVEKTEASTEVEAKNAGEGDKMATEAAEAAEHMEEEEAIPPMVLEEDEETEEEPPMEAAE